MGWFERLDTWMWRTPETHAIDKAALWRQGADIGDPVHAGVVVSQENALKFAVVWRCIRLISGTLAGLPADVVRKRGDIREPVDPPTWMTTPNPESNWFEFVERIFESLLMDGNAFILVTARDSGFPSEVWTLHPREIDVRREGGEIVYLWGGSTRLSRYSPTNLDGDVLHVKFATGGGLRGMSPIEAARQSIGLGLVAEKFGARFFGRGQQPSGVIQMPPSDPVRTREFIAITKENWQRDHGGSDRSHLPGILTGGAEWKPMSITPEEAQFLQTRAFQVEDIATRFYGIPAYLVGLTEKQTSWGAGVEQQSIGLYRFTLRDHISRFEAAMSTLVPSGRFVRLNPAALLEADAKTQAEILQMELQNGVTTRNEWRALGDKAPLPGGDRAILPLNMQILQPNGQAEPTPAPTPTPNGNGQQPAEVTT
jgi:HK97 family phage portal protein